MDRGFVFNLIKHYCNQVGTMHGCVSISPMTSPVCCSDSFIHQDSLSCVKGPGKFPISCCIHRDFKPLLSCDLQKKIERRLRLLEDALLQSIHGVSFFPYLLHPSAAGSADHTEQLLVSDSSTAVRTIFGFGGFNQNIPSSSCFTRLSKLKKNK